jgi:Tfp pilus assembly PilM family ATPase/Tfp pilus assembly protein PilN
MGVKARKVLLVEAGGEWIKVAQVEPVSGGAAFSRLIMAKVGYDSDAAARALAAVRKGIGNEPVIACLPRQAVTVRMVEFPSVDAAEIEDMVDLQIGKQTPHSREEIEYDFRILGATKPGYSRVMLVIAQRSILRSVYYIFENAGIEPEKLSVTTEGLLNWCDMAGGRAQGETVAVVDIDSFFTDVLVVSDNGPVYSRSFLMGADALLDGTGENMAGRLVKEVAASLEACRAENSGVNIRRLVLAGSGAGMSKVAGLLGETTGLEVKVLDSTKALKRMVQSPSLTDPEYQAVSITALIGAAMNPDSLGFHLVPETIGVRKRLVTRAQILTVMGMLVMALLISLSLLACFRYAVRQQQINALADRKAAISADVMAIEEKAAVLGLIRKRGGVSHDAMHLMAQVPLMMEGDIKLSSLDLDIQSERFTIEGHAASTREIRSLVKNLEQNPCFMDVKESSTMLDKNSGRYKFQIVGALEVLK